MYLVAKIFLAGPGSSLSLLPKGNYAYERGGAKKKKKRKHI